MQLDAFNVGGFESSIGNFYGFSPLLCAFSDSSACVCNDQRVIRAVAG
jgi:hypothetical protein